MKLYTGFLTFVLFVICSLSATTALAAAPDGSGPWADSVVSSSQGLMKNGSPVPGIRSDASQAVGVAEETIVDGTFFSLGFGGTITLQFNNPVMGGVVVVESTNPGYPSEEAQVEVSSDNATWTNLGSVTQTGELSQGESSVCVRYVRITDISSPDNFVDDTADGYDVDGVRITQGESCPEVTVTPTPTGIITPTPTPGNNNNNGGGSSSTVNNSQPTPCTASKPGTPSITSVQRTSGSTVQLTWTQASNATSYAISYGTSSGNYQYGVPSTGNVTTYTVGGLDPNANYFFIVRAVNDCTPGDASSESSTSGGQVLGVSTSQGQVLGASTDVLAATGSFNRNVFIAWMTAIIAAFISGVVYFRRATHGS